MEQKDPKLEAAHREFEENIQRLAKRAMSMFVSASSLSPANTRKQGIRIAKHCREENLDPNFLKSLLLSNDALLEQIRSKAEAVHKKGSGEKGISLDGVGGIIDADFSLAAEFVQLDEAEFSRIFSTL